MSADNTIKLNITKNMAEKNKLNSRIGLYDRPASHCVNLAVSPHSGRSPETLQGWGELAIKDKIVLRLILMRGVRLPFDCDRPVLSALITGYLLFVLWDLLLG